MKLYVKNMACVRCEMIVKSELTRLGLPFKTVQLGEFEIDDNISMEQRNLLDDALNKFDMALLDDKKSILVEKIKTAIIEFVNYNDVGVKGNLSDYIKNKLGYDYAYLSRLFAESKGSTIENFFIVQRIKRAKEMLVCDDSSISEISEKLHFSDASHFNKQFKKVTGLTPSYYREIKKNRLPP